MKAVDALKEQGGALAPLSVKVAPELKEKMSAFRKQTGKRPSEIVAEALNEYFDGYVPVEDDDLEED